MEPNHVTFEEVLDTIKESGFNKCVDIWIDACYSSENCFSARNLMKTGKYNFELTVQVAADRDKKVQVT